MTFGSFSLGTRRTRGGSRSKHIAFAWGDDLLNLPAPPEYRGAGKCTVMKRSPTGLNMDRSRSPVKIVLLRLSGVMLVVAASLPLTYLLPPIDLTGSLAQAAYWVAESGGTFGIPIIALAMTALVIGRAGLSKKQRAVEGLVIVSALAALLGVGAYVNEHFVKPVFMVHRPNIIELSTATGGSSALQLSAGEFYAIPTKVERSAHLKTVLKSESGPKMHENVRSHWILETGFSFPSGHSFSAMFFATSFLALGLSFFSDARLWIFYFLVGWAIAVCYSRPILRVHSPTDVCVGGLEGILGGVLCFLVVRGVLELVCPNRALAASANSDNSTIQPDVSRQL